MVERAGVDMDAPDTLASGAVRRLAEQPNAMALARQVRNQADKGNLAFAFDPEIEIEHADDGLDSRDLVELDLRIGED